MTEYKWGEPIEWKSYSDDGWILGKYCCKHPDFPGLHIILSDGSILERPKTHIRHPRPDFKTGDRVLVRNVSEWCRRYFSHWDDDGKPCCFDGGNTEWSAQHGTCSWHEIKPWEDAEEGG